jgi:hypothetical protein
VWEQRIAHYARIAEELGELQSSMDLGFVHINVGSLAAAIREEALAWLRVLCERMRSKDMSTLEVGNE